MSTASVGIRASKPAPWPPTVPKSVTELTTFWQDIGSANEQLLGKYPAGWQISPGDSFSSTGILNYPNVGVPFFSGPTVWVVVYNPTAGGPTNFNNRVLIQRVVNGVPTTILDTLGTPQGAGTFTYSASVGVNVGTGTSNNIRISTQITTSAGGTTAQRRRFVLFIGLG